DEVAPARLPGCHPPRPGPQLLFLQPHDPHLSFPLPPDTRPCHAAAPRLPVGSHRGRAGGLTLVEPGEIGLVAIQDAGDGIYKDMIGRHRSQPTRLFQRQNALDPPIALGTGRPQRALAAEHPTPQGAVELSEEIAPPWSSKPCVPLSRHTAPQLSG